jgi:hypothetical protein
VSAQSISFGTGSSFITLALKRRPELPGKNGPGRSRFNIRITPGRARDCSGNPFGLSQKIGAKSPVCGVLRRKCAQIPNSKGAVKQAPRTAAVFSKNMIFFIFWIKISTGTH